MLQRAVTYCPHAEILWLMAAWISPLRAAKGGPSKLHSSLGSEDLKPVDRIGMNWACEKCENMWKSQTHMILEKLLGEIALDTMLHLLRSSLRCSGLGNIVLRKVTHVALRHWAYFLGERGISVTSKPGICWRYVNHIKSWYTLG